MKWISVEDRLPEDIGMYIVFRDNSCIGGTVKCVDTKLFHDRTWITDGYDGKITHWQPLPKPPKATP